LGAKIVKGLIIDDEAIIALHISLIAKKSGIGETFLANNANSAIQIFEKEKPNILFIDINLAGDIDGFELSKILCKNNHTPVIFISGNPNKDIKGRLEYEKLPFTHNYMVKPIDDLALKKLIKTMIE